jgi:hypothetical protein
MQCRKMILTLLCSILFILTLLCSILFILTLLYPPPPGQMIMNVPRNDTLCDLNN